MNYTGVVISDIHFGAIDMNELKKELSEGFLYQVINMDKLDFLVIDGDYFDHKIWLDDSSIPLSFMDTLVSLAKEKHFPIRCVYGTESHEADQYTAFSMYETDPDVDFKVIRVVEEEELLQDLHILYVPEEHILSKEEYYKDFFGKKSYYDYVFGHGVIQEVMTHSIQKPKKKKKSLRKKVPVFSSAELDQITKGQVYFGHYHINTNIKDKIFYVGSYSRWIHGEESPKGFYVLHCDTAEGTYTNEFIENQYAKMYVTYRFGYKECPCSEEDLIIDLEKKDKWAEAQGIDHVKYVFNIPEDHPNPEFIIRVLNERYKYNKTTQVEVTNGYVEKKKKFNKEKLSNVLTRYPLVFDKSASFESKVEYFIKVNKDREIPIEHIRFHLYGKNEEVDT